MGITKDMQQDFQYFSFPCKDFWQFFATCNDETEVESNRYKNRPLWDTLPVMLTYYED